jgi:hypothetical protein
VGICTNDVEAYPDDRPERLAEQAQRAGWVFLFWSTTTNRSVVPTTQPARLTSSCTTDSAGCYRGAFDESTPGNGKAVTDRCTPQSSRCSPASWCPNRKPAWGARSWR